MKTARNIWKDIIDFDNLHSAWREASKGRRYRQSCLEFGSKLEENLITIQNELIWKTYRPQDLHQFLITDPKRRLISAPHFRDRVVQHALYRIIEPILDTGFIYDSHACRKGHGVHLAVKRLQTFTRKAHRCGSFWFYKGDIKSYFPSIPHQLLKNMYARKIGDANALALINLFIDAYNPLEKGIPIGALTSQLSANLFLDALDHYVKEELKTPLYVRYMDDFIIIENNKEELKTRVCEIESFIINTLHLEVNPKSGTGYGIAGIPFCGYRVFPTHVLIRKATLRRGSRHLRKQLHLYSGEKAQRVHIRASITSFSGHLAHCQAHRSTLSFFKRVILKGGTIDTNRNRRTSRAQYQAYSERLDANSRCTLNSKRAIEVAGIPTKTQRRSEAREFPF